MDTYKIVVLDRRDLRENHKPLKLDQITLYDFDYTLEKKIIQKSDFLIFVDSPKEYVILKNRYTFRSKETNGILAFLGLEKMEIND